MSWISSLVGLCLVVCINGQDGCGENIGRCNNVGFYCTGYNFFYLADKAMKIYRKQIA